MTERQAGFLVGLMAGLTFGAALVALICEPVVWLAVLPFAFLTAMFLDPER